MSKRSVTLSLGAIFAAHAALRRLAVPATPDTAPGMPSPPFPAVLRVSGIVQALSGAVQSVNTQMAHVKNQFARRDESGAAVPVTDPNGNVQPGAFHIADPTAYGHAIATLEATETTVELPRLTLDDIVDVGRRLSVAELADVLPLVDPDAMDLTEGAAQRLAAYDAWAADMAARGAAVRAAADAVTRTKIAAMPAPAMPAPSADVARAPDVVAPTIAPASVPAVTG